MPGYLAAESTPRGDRQFPSVLSALCTATPAGFSSSSPSGPRGWIIPSLQAGSVPAGCPRAFGIRANCQSQSPRALCDALLALAAFRIRWLGFWTGFGLGDGHGEGLPGLHQRLTALRERGGPDGPRGRGSRGSGTCRPKGLRAPGRSSRRSAEPESPVRGSGCDHPDRLGRRGPRRTGPFREGHRDL